MPQKPYSELDGIEGELFQILKSRMEAGRTPVPMGEGNPEPSQSAAPGPSIPVLGSRYLNDLVQHYQRGVPELHKYVTRVVESPNQAAQEVMDRSGIPLSRAPFTNLLGAFDPDFEDIYMSPSLPQRMVEPTLVHELMHALGNGRYDNTPTGHERDIYNAQGLAQMMADYRLRKSDEEEAARLAAAQGIINAKFKRRPR